MSALVILECNACGAITPPWPTAERVREEVAPEGWAVDVDGSNVDYCPQYTAPAGEWRVVPIEGPAISRLEVARRGVTQLRDALAAIALADCKFAIRPEDMRPDECRADCCLRGPRSSLTLVL